MPTRDIKTNLLLEGEENYKKAIDNAIHSVKLLGSEVKENTARYKLNSDSVEGNREKLATLQKEIAQQERLVALYTAAIEENAAAGKENTKETQKYEEQLAKAKVALAAMNTELQETEAKIPSVKDRIKELSSNLGENLVMTTATAGKAVAASLAAIGTACLSAGKAVLQLVNDTEEYRTSLSMLQQNSEDAGVAFDHVKGKMIEISSISGDTGAAVEAVSNLLATGFDEQGLTAAVDALSGAVIKFPDTLKIESLADGLQETIATGEGAGAFAELIERMGGNLEQFNTQLAGCTTEAERQEVALKWLAESGLADVAASYRETNAASLDAKEASMRMNDALASLAGAVEPAVATVKSGLADVVTAFVGMVTGAEGAEQDFEKSIDNLITNATNMINEWLPKVLKMGSEILMKLVDGLMKAIPKLTEALPKIVNTLLTYLTDNLPLIIESGIKIIVALAEGIVSAIPGLVANLPQIIAAIVKGVASGVKDLWNVGKQLVAGLWEGIQSAAGWIWEKITGWLGGIWDGIKGFFGIHSPSARMRDEVGVMLGRGLIEGLEKEKVDVKDAFDGLIPNAKNVMLNVETQTRSARFALSSPITARSGTETALDLGLNDGTLRKLSDYMVDALDRAGIGEAVIKLNDREFGRTIRRGLEVGFV